MINKVYNENCLKTINKLDDNIIQSIITSPPYYNLRDYENKNQLGQEKTIKLFLDNLINIFIKCKRILKKNGLIFINMGDTYGKNKSLLGIPDRLKIRLIENGFICRNDIIWHKPNAIPQSAKDRFTIDYERFFMFSLNKNYQFFTQYEQTKTIKSNKSNKSKKSKYKNIEHEKNHRQGMDKNRGNKLIEKRPFLPEQKKIVNFFRKKTSAKKIHEEHPEIKLTKIEHWFRKDKAGFSYPSAEDWNKIKYLLDDWSEEFYNIDKGLNYIEYESDEINKNYKKGRLKRSVWSINTKANKYKHFASYPEKLIITPILCSTKENDIIYDPFAGSGTTGVVAKALKRNFILSELNENYFNIIKKRLNEKTIIKELTQDKTNQLTLF
jgi:DNA modification methylase